jgi:hypothetical protein
MAQISPHSASPYLRQKQLRKQNAATGSLHTHRNCSRSCTPIGSSRVEAIESHVLHTESKTGHVPNADANFLSPERGVAATLQPALQPDRLVGGAVEAAVEYLSDTVLVLVGWCRSL